MKRFLGLDFSTQKLKAVVVDEELRLVHESEVDFELQLPEFRTHRGVIRGEGGSATTPVLLWVKALDLLLDQMQVEGVNFGEIRAVSGAAQQHGSVYWQKGCLRILQDLDPCLFLHQQLRDCFSIRESPIWMDSSTAEYCKRLEEAVGGPQRMAEITGSRAYERFTASQIAKIAETREAAFENCERISLVSNFACSLFLGDYADVDYADASGTNLMNIRTKSWDETCLQAVKATDIGEKLGNPIAPHTELGPVSRYFVTRFGFDRRCSVASFTGDNPASFVGLGLSDRDAVVSLGTSDTVILPMREPTVFADGHLICSATEADAFLGLLCFRNGSLTRERVRDASAGGSWAEFERLLGETPRGNFGNVAAFFDQPEILPCARPGDFRWNRDGRPVARFSSDEIEVRALVEGQFLARRAFAEQMGFVPREGGRIVATGGGSRNRALLQVLSDVFNLPVYSQDCSNSAALGAAYLAKMAIEPRVTFRELVARLPEPVLICKPNKDAVEIYDPMLKRYQMLISSLKKSSDR